MIYADKKIDKVVTFQAQRYLRDVNDKSKSLTKDRTEAFPSVATKLLWIIKRAKSGLEKAAGYLCTRVSKSDEGNWKML